jgi:hypothetical protein
MDRLASTRRLVRPAMIASVLVCWSLLVPSPADASCVEMTEAEQRAQADVVFDGRALPGPVADGVLLTPARFEVDAYSKGDGPDVVEVVTATRDEGGGIVSHLSVGISPRAGETWRIYAQRPAGGGALETSECAGSTRLAGTPPTDAGAETGEDAPGGSTSNGVMPTDVLMLIAVVLTVSVAALAGRRWQRRRPA